MATDATLQEDTHTELARELGLLQIVLFGVGGIVGAGIYAIIGEAAAFGGSLLWLSFLIAAVVALMTAATYAELVSRYPDAGGSFEYVKRAFGLRVASGASIVMFFTGVVAAGAIAISFSSYLSRLLDIPQTLTTIGVISLMGIVNIVGAAQASWFNTLATIVTLVGLGAVVVVAAPDIGSVDLFTTSETDLLGLGVGSALIFFSFIGFEDLVKLAEETKEPETTMPRGLLISGVIVLVIYLLVAIAAVSALGTDQLSESSGPLAEIMQAKAGSSWATAIVVVALFATSKTVLSNVLGTSRLLFDVARDAGVPWLRRLTRINATTNTPIAAIVVVTLTAIGFGAIGNLRVVAAISNIAIMIVFILVNVALLRIRLTSEEVPKFQVPVSIGRFPVTALVALAGTIVLLCLNLVALSGAAQ